MYALSNQFASRQLGKKYLIKVLQTPFNFKSTICHAILCQLPLVENVIRKLNFHTIHCVSAVIAVVMRIIFLER